MQTISLPGLHRRAAIFWILSLLLFWQPLRALAALSFRDENSAHILLIPAISALLIYLARRRIFRQQRSSLLPGAPMLLVMVFLWFGLQGPLAFLDPRDRLSVQTALIVLVWVAGFVLCYGIACAKAAAFPLFFLLLMVPLPLVALHRLILLLQSTSADVCAVLFRVLGIPFLRHGFQFSLPGVKIEVAEACSGIHSGLSLFIVGLLAAHVFLRAAWKKVCFTLFILPIAIFKNAVRIVTIAWLGIHVNRNVFEGPIHRQGGLPFSAVALLLMMVLLWLLARLPFSAAKTEGGNPAKA